MIGCHHRAVFKMLHGMQHYDLLLFWKGHLTPEGKASPEIGRTALCAGSYLARLLPRDSLTAMTVSSILEEIGAAFGGIVW